MSRAELDEIQSQLKASIQNHQVLVSKIQLQPQDMSLKTQLRFIQKDIMALSQRQKLFVQQQKLDLINRQSSEQLDREDNNAVAKEKENEIKTEDVDKTESNEKLQTSPLRVPQYQSVNSNKSQEKMDSSGSEKTPSKQTQVNSSTEKARELKRKLDFMASIDLVPPDSVKESPGKRTERKRKSTNNPNFAYGFELERRPKLSTFLATDYFGAKKTKTKPVQSSNMSPQDSEPASPGSEKISTGMANQNNTKENMPKSGICKQCGKNGQCLQCEMCGQIYHPDCAPTPGSQLSCTKCQESTDRVNSSSLSAVSSYISKKAGKEEERRRLLKRSSELLQEKLNLENRTKQLSEILSRQGIKKQELIDINLKAKQSVENLKKFVKAVQSS